MNERIFGYRIKQLLNDAPPVDASVQERLDAARVRALAHQRQEAEPGTSLAWAGTVSRRLTDSLGQPRSLAVNLLLSVLVFAGGLLVIQQFYESQMADEIEEIDAAVLTGELPLDAYLDKGFDAWLKRSSP